MKNILYDWASSYINSINKKRELKNKSRVSEADIFLQKRNYILKEFYGIYEDRMKKEFEENSKPLFKVGEQVLTNWYGHGDSWESNMQHLQKHTPFRGPTYVEITKVVLDTQYLYHQLELSFDTGIFDKLPQDYDLIASVFERDMKYNRHISSTIIPLITWAYKIKTSDEIEYWRYTISERKLLKADSRNAKLSLKAWEFDEKSQKLSEEMQFNLANKMATLKLMGLC